MERKERVEVYQYEQWMSETDEDNMTSEQVHVMYISLKFQTRQPFGMKHTNVIHPPYHRQRPLLSLPTPHVFSASLFAHKAHLKNRRA